MTIYDIQDMPDEMADKAAMVAHELGILSGVPFNCFFHGAAWANEQNAAEIADMKFRIEGDAILLQAANQTIEKERAKTEILHGAYDTARSHNSALQAENAQLRYALEGLLRVVNVRIDDQRIAQFDAARTALNSAKPDPLYAAAPEMLKALEMIENLQSKTRICFDASDAESMWDTLQEVFIIASNPIAKLYKAI